MNWSVFPEDVSVFGHKVDDLFYLAFWLTAVTFVLVIGILGYFMWRYRSKNAPQPYYTHGNSFNATMLTVGLAIVVFVVIDINLAVRDHFAWEDFLGKPASPDALHVEIMPEQFVWNIRYAGADGKFGTADDVANINELHVPMGRDIVVALRSKDVIHSFFLPNFRIKQDAVPGMVTYTKFKAAKKGSFDIACAQHCGLAHYRMRGILTVESPEVFQSWLSGQSLQGSENNWGWMWEVNRK